MTNSLAHSLSSKFAKQLPLYLKVKLQDGMGSPPNSFKLQATASLPQGKTPGWDGIPTKFF